MKGLQQISLGLCNTTRACAVLVAVTALLTLGSSRATAQTGYDSLFIGHSFFRPVAEQMPFHAALVGLVDHTQFVVFSGGASGSPQALWENAAKRAEIQAILGSGNVELFGMTYAPEYPTTEGYENWINYALEQNSETRFFIGLPWADFPGNYDAQSYGAALLQAHEAQWHPFIDQLKMLYPDNEVFCIPYGLGAAALRQLFEAGNLPDVDHLTHATEDSIFNDAKGHADDILIDQAALIWLNAIYDVDLNTYAWDPGYVTDIKAIAQQIADAHEAGFSGPVPVPVMTAPGIVLLAGLMGALGARSLLARNRKQAVDRAAG